MIRMTPQLPLIGLANVYKQSKMHASHCSPFLNVYIEVYCYNEFEFARGIRDICRILK